MKKQLKTLTQSVLGDRWLLGLIVLNAFITLGILIWLVAVIRPSETQVIVQQSSFSVAGLYNGYWYTHWTYGALQLLLLTGHVVLAIKLRQAGLRDLALSLLWVTVLLSVILVLFAHSIIRIASVGY
ncbi:MAG: hypothetical protein Q4F02_01320 [Candidatus Saccharibacteria bacterium]|nr:hypothetical protein [Candidatus Saccharibacteria bacterium]